MKFSRLRNFLVVLTIVTVLSTGISLVLQNRGIFFADKVVAVLNSQSSDLNKINNTLPSLPPPPQKLSNPPEIVKSVYVTGYSAGSKLYLNYLTNLFKNTEINAVVVDIKGSSGYVSYASGSSYVEKYNLHDNSIKDIDALVRFFHDQNIYVIGRVAVFEDPVFSRARPDLAIYNKTETVRLTGAGQVDPSNKILLWKDNNKLSWLDPASKDVWDYNVSIAKDAFYHGFDEINFDYIRFPSDGKTADMGFPVWDGKTPKRNIIKSFFKYLRDQLPNEKISADLFGQTTVNTDDMGIGQVIEDAFNNFDFISPMIYPSHYINGFIGFKNPAAHPYEIIKYSMDKAASRKKLFLQPKEDIFVKTSEAAIESQITKTSPVAKFRPWVQDFNMGAEYTADMVKQEIKAIQDALGEDFKGYMLWNPSNIYTQEAIFRPN